MNQNVINYLIEAPWYGAFTMSGMVLGMTVLGTILSIVCLFLSGASFSTSIKGIASSLFFMVPMVLLVLGVLTYQDVNLELEKRYTMDKNIFVDSLGSVVKVEGQDQELVAPNGDRVKYTQSMRMQTLGQLDCRGSLAECNDLLTNNQEKIVEYLMLKRYVRE